MFGINRFHGIVALAFAPSSSLAMTVGGRHRQLPSEEWPTQLAPISEQVKYIHEAQDVYPIQEDSPLPSAWLSGALADNDTNDTNVTNATNATIATNATNATEAVSQERGDDPPVEASGVAGDQASATSEPMLPCPCSSFVDVLSDTLPNVMVIGDQTFLDFFETVQAFLSPVASVHRAPLFYVEGEGDIPTTCGTTSHAALACMDQWLGNSSKFKAVLFNWGLLDVRAHGLMNKTEGEAYALNIKDMYVKIMHHLKDQGVAIWLNTPPVSPKNVGPSTNEEISEANRFVEDMWQSLEENPPPIREDFNKAVVHSCHLNASQKDFPHNDVECLSLMEPETAAFNALGKQLLAVYTAELIRSNL